MGISASDVITLSHARANYSELAEVVKSSNPYSAMMMLRSINRQLQTVQLSRPKLRHYFCQRLRYG